MTSLVEECRSIGLEVHVTDNAVDSPAKKASDQGHDISVFDVPAILKLIREHKINGVLCGFVDSLLPSYYEICRYANLPCYISDARQIAITTNKTKLKKELSNFSIPVLKSYDDAVPAEEFPVIVKPTDNSGSRGIKICECQDQLASLKESARQYSSSGEVLVERMLTAPEATAFYYVRDGEISFLGVADREVKPMAQGELPLPVLYRFPSQNESAYVCQLDEKVRRLIKHLDIGNGLVYMQMFFASDIFWVYEFSFRLTGSLEYKIFEKKKGLNAAKELAAFAVGLSSQEMSPSHSHSTGYNLTISCAQKDSIARLEGVDRIANHSDVIYCHVSHGEKGRKVTEPATLGLVVCRVFFFAQSKRQFKEIVSYVKRNFKIIANDGSEVPFHTV
ncbi:hypothetical protein QO259_09010 [Salinicola sp. JS01]|uniref:ATP-grasp domain-containing protein n=1 Tax=Salinicola sp. JS01 TaxID=3050071 RepID=UPI00255B548A|nr:hypothetical protein [Salinicola sp. JS01]WIX34761.1 hypothetical protein QO259_09010 [Salinicola sp. JS01]